MKALFIGGTGNISTASSRLAIQRGIDLYVLNRGTTKADIPGVKSIVANIHDKDQAAKALAEHTWDVVVNWIAFTPACVQRDIELFAGRTKQYIFISSASAYQKPPAHPIVTESTPLANPYWEYSRNKIAAEETLNEAYRTQGFPTTIVRPSLTYDTVVPLPVGAWTNYGIIARMMAGKKVPVPGDGTSLWTVTHSDDFAKGFVGLMGHQQALGHAFHITSDEVLTWNQIYQATAAAAGAEANIVHVPSDFMIHVAPELEGTLLGDKSHSAIFDNTKLKTFVPDFTATIPYAQGIKRTVEWFQADPARMTINPDDDATMDKILAEYAKVFPAASPEA